MPWSATRACRVENRCDPGGIDRVDRFLCYCAAVLADPPDRLVDVVDSEIGCPVRDDCPRAGSPGGDSGDGDVILGGHRVSGLISGLPGMSGGDWDVDNAPTGQFGVGRSGPREVRRASIPPKRPQDEGVWVAGWGRLPEPFARVDGSGIDCLKDRCQPVEQCRVPADQQHQFALFRRASGAQHHRVHHLQPVLPGELRHPSGAFQADGAQLPQIDEVGREPSVAVITSITASVSNSTVSTISASATATLGEVATAPPLVRKGSARA